VQRQLERLAIAGKVFVELARGGVQLWFAVLAIRWRWCRVAVRQADFDQSRTVLCSPSGGGGAALPCGRPTSTSPAPSLTSSSGPMGESMWS